MDELTESVDLTPAKRNFMIDIEAMGTRIQDRITSIAVREFFLPSQQNPRFGHDFVTTILNCRLYNTIPSSTWRPALTEDLVWRHDNGIAEHEQTLIHMPEEDILSVLRANFMPTDGAPVNVWAWHTHYDIAKLAYLGECMGEKPFLPYQTCYDTPTFLASMGYPAPYTQLKKKVEEIYGPRVAHQALADCTWQILMMDTAMQMLPDALIEGALA